MPVTPFRVRATEPGQAPGWLREGTGERLLQTFGLMIDCRLERLSQGMLAHMPRSDISGTQAPYDAQLVIAGDRLLVPGPSESRASLASRNQHAFETWQLAGLPRSVEGGIVAFLSTSPQIRTVATKYNPSTYPPTRVSSTWATYTAGADLSIAPVQAFGLAGGAGDWNWDSTSQITGSWGWWSGYVIIYSVSPNAWCTIAQAWGAGSTYTPSVDGYYSTTSGGAYVPSGSYTGTSQAWGAGATYVPSADGYYSKVVNGAYVASGYYVGTSQAWGINQNGNVGSALVQIARQFKPDNMWIRSIIVSFSSALFDPADTADGIDNPAGTFGQWSVVTGGAYAPARFGNAVYSGEVI